MESKCEKLDSHLSSLPPRLSDTHSELYRESSELSAALTAENEQLQQKLLQLEANFMTTRQRQNEQKASQKQQCIKNCMSLDQQLQRKRSQSQVVKPQVVQNQVNPLVNINLPPPRLPRHQGSYKDVKTAIIYGTPQPDACAAVPQAAAIGEMNRDLQKGIIQHLQNEIARLQEANQTADELRDTVASLNARCLELEGVAKKRNAAMSLLEGLLARGDIAQRLYDELLGALL